MKLERALIVHKKSAYETYFKSCRNPRLRHLVKCGDPGLSHIRRSHDAHYGTLASVEKALRKAGMRVRRVARGVPFDERRFDLIVSVGGDGTFLDAARSAKLKPILGVNSDPRHSVGRLCSVNRADFERALDAVRGGRFRVLRLNRLRLTVNGREHRYPVLNDILFCHASPGAMSHYFLLVDGERERQRSSGVWVSTAAGATGAMRSSGGADLPIESDRIQYRPRELFEGHGVRYRLRGGKLGPASAVTLISQMEEGLVFVDGPHNPLPVHYADRVRLEKSPYPAHSVLPRL